MQIYIAHASSFPYLEKLYKPLRESALNSEHEILLPHEGEVEEITREMIKAADVLVAEVSEPSVGAGIEMGWADSFGIPVIAMHEENIKPSFSIDNVVTEGFGYSNSEDMLQKLTAVLEKFK